MSLRQQSAVSNKQKNSLSLSLIRWRGSTFGMEESSGLTLRGAKINFIFALIVAMLNFIFANAGTLSVKCL